MKLPRNKKEFALFLLVISVYFRIYDFIHIRHLSIIFLTPLPLFLYLFIALIIELNKHFYLAINNQA